MCHINQLYLESEEEEEEEDESTDTVHCGTRGIKPAVCLYAASIFSTYLQHFFQSSWVTYTFVHKVPFGRNHRYIVYVCRWP